MIKEITPEKALYKAAAYCSKSEHCRSEVAQKLTQWGLPASEHKAILDYLEQERYLDEFRFARAYTKDKLLYNKWGLYKIRVSLQQKQIAPTVIEEVFASAEEETNYEETLLNLLEKKKIALSAKETDKMQLKSKLFRFALSRGYESKIVLKTLSQLLKEE